MTDFDESRHARDTTGRFTEMAGSEQTDTLGSSLSLGQESVAIGDLPDDLCGDVLNGRKSWDDAMQAARERPAKEARERQAESIARRALDKFAYVPGDKLSFSRALDVAKTAALAALDTAQPATPALPAQPSSDEVRRADISCDLRAGEREVSDDVARIIAADALHYIPTDAGTAAEYPMLRRVAEDPGYAWSADGNGREMVQLHAELGRLYASPYLSAARKTRINMLFTFAMYGGDNS